jgi:hypothetical protein
MDTKPSGRDPSVAPRVVKAKPDPRPMRLALGAGGLAAFSAILAAIVIPPGSFAGAAQSTQSNQSTDQSASAPAASPSTIQVQHQILYIQLQPGQTAPPGAKVIDPAAPKPITVVTTVPAPARAAAPAQKPIIIKTTQSGTVVK